MKIHRKLTWIAGLGMLLVIATSVFFFQDKSAAFLLSFRGIAEILLVLFISTIFLVLFRVYLRRKVSTPLKELLQGTEEIGKGNLDYQIQVNGTHDIALLAQRFNEMARKLNQSYTMELEQKLLDQTRELAALSAVALELGRAGSLSDMLDKSLAKIFESLPDLEPRGGIFLCDSSGEALRLIVHKGLSPEFVQKESSVGMEECLCCGNVAKTGEVLYTKNCVEEQLHTRPCFSGPHAHVIFPIKSRGIVLGVVFLYPSSAFNLKPSDIQTFQMIGSQLGLAVENFGFYSEAKDASMQFWDLYENARDILFTVDPAGMLLSVNNAFEQFFGYSKLELIGKNMLDFLTHDSAQTAMRILAESSLPNIVELEVVKRDSSRAFVEVSCRRLFRGTAPAGFQISARDITEQKTLRELLVKAERCAAIGQVGIAVRHEINNPLTSVIGNVELLLERAAGKNKELETRLEIILNNALRISDIIRRVEGIQQEKVVDYLKGIKMTDLKKK